MNPNLVVIDAGHGADDGGKVGINGAVEKDINLIMSKKIEKYLHLLDKVSLSGTWF